MPARTEVGQGTSQAGEKSVEAWVGKLTGIDLYRFGPTEPTHQIIDGPDNIKMKKSDEVESVFGLHPRVTEQSSHKSLGLGAHQYRQENRHTEGDKSVNGKMGGVQEVRNGPSFVPFFST